MRCHVVHAIEAIAAVQGTVRRWIMIKAVAQHLIQNWLLKMFSADDNHAALALPFFFPSRNMQKLPIAKLTAGRERTTDEKGADR